MTIDELNAALAERLFGWRRADPPNSHWWIKPNGYRVSPIDWVMYTKSWAGTGDGMLLVLEAMRGRGWNLLLVSGAGDDSSACFSRGETEAWVEDASVTEAVARAALAALEAEK